MYVVNIKNVEMLRIKMSLSIAYFTGTVGINIDDYMNYIDNPHIECRVNDTQVNLITKIFGVPRELITSSNNIIDDDSNNEEWVLDHLYQFQKKVGSTIHRESQ